MKRIDPASRTDWRLFHQVPRFIYRHDPHWIEPLHSDVESVFDPEQNQAMASGVAALWIVQNERGQPLGRIAAFVDPARNREMNLRIGGIGFFECIDAPQVAHTLLETAETFLRKQNVQVIDGIINFGERDKFWGLLTEGFTSPLYQENYHLPYYRAFFEARDYQPHEQILTFKGDLGDVPAQRLQAIAQRAEKRHGFVTKTLRESHFTTFARHFAQAYNAAFAEKPHFKPISESDMVSLFRKMRPITDPNMVCITYHGETPIGFAGFLPDINPYLKVARGQLNWRTLPGFLMRLKTARSKLLKGIAFGIDPQWQGKGVFAALVNHTYNQKTMDQYQNYFLAAIRAHNTLMVRSVKSLGVRVDRIHMSFRKKIDPMVSVSPYPFLDPEK